MNTETYQYVPLPTEPPTEYAPTDRWVPDILGAGFEARTLPLGMDDEGEVVATVVRYRPQQDPNAIAGTPQRPGFAVLYLHGWNDYFFNREIARHFSYAGGAFYAIELHKYGRSLRPGQTIFYTRSIADYDAEISAAFDLIVAENPGLPLLFGAHSFGGLVAPLWVHHNPGRVEALLLNSPWIAMQGSLVERSGATVLGETLGIAVPHQTVPITPSNGYPLLLAGWQAADGPIPQNLRRWEWDPSLSGYGLVADWKREENADITAGWGRAVVHGQREIRHGIETGVPTLLMCARHSDLHSRWHPQMHRMDTVLDADRIASRAPKLGSEVTIRRLFGRHDLFISLPPDRIRVWRTVHSWLAARMPGAVPLADLQPAGIDAICP
ncbi:MAG: alpha/beta hydrolase [Varibaculum sp.]|nr:alpha/beta hydrolase [Varibaculum sp.]